MKKILCCSLALLMVFCLFLGGCSRELPPWLRMQNSLVTPFDQMQYTRPDPEALQQTLDTACSLVDGIDADKALEGIFDFYDAYDQFSTNTSLAFIHYSHDTSDTYWQEENSYCTEVTPLLETALEQLYEHIAGSALRQQLEENYFGEDFFAYYDDNTDWDETTTKLLEEEAALLEEYYTLSQEADSAYEDDESYYDKYYEPMAALYAKLILKRQELAAQFGYADYATFAFENYHMRSYSPAQAEKYLEKVAQHITPLYRQIAETDMWYLEDCTTEETFAYVQAAASAMGGTPAEAFTTLQTNKLYDIEYGLNKYPGAFETYLWTYNAPFVFVDPYMDQSDKLAFAHEFGHFSNDFAVGGSYVGTDVAEIHSQAFEYLSLCYTEGSDDLTRYKLAESICTYAEQSAYALFELKAHALTQEELTPENLLKLYEEIGNSFGFDSYEWDPRDFIIVPHFFTDAMYVLSYVVSNDLAMQIYEMEQTEKGTGLALYERCLGGEQEDIGSFISEFDLVDPLTEERLKAVTAFVEGKLFP